MATDYDGLDEATLQRMVNTPIKTSCEMTPCYVAGKRGRVVRGTLGDSPGHQEKEEGPRRERGAYQGERKLGLQPLCR